ncbi:hypothetical protein FXO38_28767 [Capsicum annuum]|nr:hypothetical protein FXO38_28767 [Capsicum annuum]KAF3637404.1 hypothetical protein FXO37_24931 [Capsicum annuum]
MLLMGKKKAKLRGVPVQVGGEAGLAMRNAKSARKLVSRDFVTASDGRKFEKLHLGEYQWESYGQVFDHACNFTSGLIHFSHDVGTCAAIFTETHPE